MDDLTPLMLAVLMAESDGYSVETPARLTITEAPAKLRRMAVLLGQFITGTKELLAGLRS